MGECRYSVTILDISTRRRCVQKLSGHQRVCVRWRRRKISSPGNQTKVVQPVARRYTDRG
jgi:hypothetical protein